MGFTITSNNSMTENTVTHFSQYFNSRPDLIIYHKKELLAYVVRPTEPDLAPGYWQVPLDDDDLRPKIALPPTRDCMSL